MWRNGGAGEGIAVVEFYREVCTSDRLKIRDLSYRSPLLPMGGIYHFLVDGELELSLDNYKLFGIPILNSVNDQQALRKKFSEQMIKILMEAASKKPRLFLDSLQNYHSSGVSLYSGVPTFGESWSFHCSLPRAQEVSA